MSNLRASKIIQFTKVLFTVSVSYFLGSQLHKVEIYLRL